MDRSWARPTRCRHSRLTVVLSLPRAVVTEGKSLPTELRNQEKELRKEIEYDDEGTLIEQTRTHVDDEYATAGELDPRICLTTCRDPSNRLRQFSSEMRLMFPNATRLNRGGMTVEEMVGACKRNDFTDLIIVNEHRGEPDGLIVCHLPYGPTAFFNLKNCVMRHDIAERATMSEAYPHLIMNNFETQLGKRVSDILRYLFPVPKPDSKRVITFSNDSNHISFRHHNYSLSENKKEVNLHEVGPRFEMQIFQIRLGTLDQKEAENEWVLRPFMNTAKKRKVL